MIECRLLRGSLDRTLRDGLQQTRAYMERCAATAGHLVIFDRTPDRSWDDKIFRRTDTADDGVGDVKLQFSRARMYLSNQGHGRCQYMERNQTAIDKHVRTIEICCR